MGTTANNATVKPNGTCRGEQSPGSDEVKSIDGAVRRKHRCQAPLTTTWNFISDAPSPTSRPKAVVIAHVMPTAQGDAEQRRAWRWLDAFTRTHEVWLAVFSNQPIHLDQWRAACHVVQRWLIRPTIDRHGRKALHRWFGHDPAHALLCTEPRLQYLADSLSAADYICDFPSSYRHNRPRRRLWRKAFTRRSRLTQAVMPHPSNEADDSIGPLITVPLHHEATYLRGRYPTAKRTAAVRSAA